VDGLAGGLVRCCHPAPALGVTAVATLLAVAVGRGPLGSAAVGSAVLAGQLSVGWSNDYLDRGRDAATRRPDKPIVTGRVGAATVRRAAVLAAVCCLPLSLLSGPGPAVLHLVAVGSAWAYNLRLKATAASPLPYAVSFGLLPAFVVAGLPGHPAPPAWLVLTGALLGTGAHFANVLPDLTDDLRTGVAGLPHRLGRRASEALAGTLLMSAAVVLALAATGLPGWLRAAVVPVTAAGGLVGGLLGRRHRSRAAFLAVIWVAAADVAFLLVAGQGVR
jgi:4-hydroxybenzoate polyprenyltransferase